MNVLITSGGTSEKIDSVRKISNTSTGRLGSLIAAAFSKLYDVNKIYYICSRVAAVPKSGKVEILYADSVADLEGAVKNVISRAEIDVIIHSMAVSDYRVKRVTSVSKLADVVIREDALNNVNSRNAEQVIAELLKTSESVIGDNGKISSGIDNMLLMMEKTPKIISMYNKLSPGAILVGFKLLDGVSRETLIDAAFDILCENKCSLVLANDLSEINQDGHIGYLVSADKSYERYSTKEEIAEAIVSAVMDLRRTRK